MGGEGGCGGVVPRQEGGRQFGGLGWGSLCWCCNWQLQFHWPLFPTGLAPSPRNGNSGTRPKENGVGTLGGGELQGVQVGRNSIWFPFAEDNFEFPYPQN